MSKFSDYVNIFVLLYGTGVIDTMSICIPPIMSMIVTHYQAGMYDNDEIDFNTALYYGSMDILVTLINFGLLSFITGRLLSKRIKFIERETKMLRVTCGSQLSRQNNKRIDKALNKIYQTMQIFWVPVDIYKSFINVIMTLYILPSWIIRLYALSVFVIAWSFVKSVSCVYIKIKRKKLTTPDIPVFDPTNTNGYNEPEKTFEKDMDIMSIDNVIEVNTLISHGKVIKEDSYKYQLEQEYNSRMKNLVRGIINTVTSSIIYMILLNTTSRGTAMTVSSLCWVITSSADSMKSLDEIYLMQELVHIRQKLRNVQHICSYDKMRSSFGPSSDITELSLSNVTLHHDSDILTDLEDTRSAQTLAINDLSYTFKRGLYYITGQNGVGKSSLFKSVVNNSIGTVKINGKDRSAYDWLDFRRLVFHLNQTNDGPALINEKMLTKLKKENAQLAEILEITDLDNIGSDNRSGSGGQEQRIHLFTALSSNAKILLLDEPFSALDVRMKQIVEEVLTNETKKRIIIVIGHDSFSDKTNGITKLMLESYKSRADQRSVLKRM